jgi:hypothetical protein
MMIKSSTVIKRMVSKNWKPFLTATFAVLVLTFVSHSAEAIWGYDSFVVYWTLAFIGFVGYALKWSYDWNKMEIRHEQERLMRELGKESNDKN